MQLPAARRARFAFSPVALVAIGLLHGAPAHGQAQAPAAAEPPLRLAPSPQLREAIAPEARGQLPTFVEGARISGRVELETTIEGGAVLRRGDTVIRADRLDYSTPDDLARARGNVRINKAGNVYEGPQLEMKVDAFEGFFVTPSYRFLRTGGWGQAERVDFLDADRAVVRRGTYTTCERQPGPSWLPEWILSADTLRLDQEAEVGYATGAVLRFHGVPILPVPALSFPLSDKRKSGLLPPTIGVDNVSGVEITQPYYWNIAPNRDATFSPTLMTKRGVDLAGEFRYLEPTYSGTLRANVLPGDRLRDRDRWSYSLQHEQLLRAPLPGALGLNLNLNRVSDDNYWRDFTRASFGTLTQRLYASDAALNWQDGRGLQVMARTLTWQTLQDTSAPIVPPYDRLPQLLARYARGGLPGGLQASVEADFTHFRSEPLRTLQPNGQRAYAQAVISRRWQQPAWYVEPRLQLHATSYRFDSPLATGQTGAQRTLPTFSIDSGLVFERETRLLGRDLLQTLEPRAFYVRTPFRAQNNLPNYDSAAVDFNFATVFTENAFSGHDRLADNNLLTLGLISRLQDEGTGAELVRAGIAQRLRFSDQRVVLPGQPPVSERLSDLLVGGSVNWTREWAADGTVQYNPKTGRSIRTTLGARYSPGAFRTVSAAYRLQRGLSEQIDIGWQWPIGDLWGARGPATPGAGRWYSVGRLNMSLKDGRVVDTILGLEYDGCCWIGRVVFERLQAGTSSANKRILFQLEFVGLSRLGSNALGTLKQNVPRYQLLRERSAPAPSRFSNYD